MATVFAESGTDATQGLEFWPTIAGTVASDTTQKKTGPRSLQCTSGSAGAAASARTATGLWGSTTGRATAYFRWTTLPTGTLTFFSITDTGGAAVVRMRISSGGVLSMWENANQIGSNGSTLVAGTWYRLCLAWNITSTTINDFRLFLNGVIDITVTNATITSTAPSALTVGWISASVGNLLVLNIDDIYADDSGTLLDTDDLRVTNKRPNANGTTNGFATQIGAGGSGYGTGHSPQVNEQPLSTTNGWSMIGAGSAITEEYTIEAVATGDVDMTGASLTDYSGWVYAKALASETASIVVGGATSNISLTSTNTLFTKAAGSTSYPGGGTDIGVVTSTDLTTVSLYECGVLFAYIQPPPPSTANEGLPYGSLTTTYLHPGKAIRRWWQWLDDMMRLLGYRRPLCS